MGLARNGVKFGEELNNENIGGDIGLADGDGAHHAVHLPALPLALPLPPPGPGEGVLDVHDLISDVLQVGVIRGADLREARM